MRRFVFLVVAGWVSAVALAVCPPCIDTNNSACNHWGSGQAFFKWASDEKAGSDITLTAGSCGQSGESATAYILYASDTHSDICNDDPSPCDDGFSSIGAVAVIQVSGNKNAFKATLGSLSFTSNKVYTGSEGRQYYKPVTVDQADCKYIVELTGNGSAHIKVTASVLSSESQYNGSRFNISVEFFDVLQKSGQSDRYVRLAATQGSIIVKANQPRDWDPVSFKPDLRDGSSMANSKEIYRNYTEDGGDSDWRLNYRGQSGGFGDCDQMEIWCGKVWIPDPSIVLVPTSETFYNVKYPGWGSGVNGAPPYSGRGGWSIEQPNSSYAMLAMNGPDRLMRYLLASSGYLSNTVYMMHYDMGNLGRMYYRGEYYSDGLRVRQIERCANGVNFGQGQILWTFCYDSQDRIQYIHNTNYDDPNNQPDPNSYNGATAYYNYQYEGTGNDPTVTYYTRPNTQSSWIPQRNWQLEFDNEGHATKFQGGCSSGCGGTGTFEHVEYLAGHDDLITMQYNAANAQILDNQYEAIEYGQYKPAGGIRIRNGGFELPDVAANNYQIVSSLFGWVLSPGNSVKICDPNLGSEAQYIEFSTTAEQTLSQTISAVSRNSFYTLQADIRAHSTSGKHVRLELWAFKDSQSSCLASVDFNDPNFTNLNWKTISLDWSSEGDSRFTGITLQDLWFFKVVVKGLKVDMDNISLSKSIRVGNTTNPMIKEQKKLNSSGQLTTTLKRQFDTDHFQILERQFVSANECRVIQYDYADQTFTTVIKKTEWPTLFASTESPSGTSYATTYSNDANNVIELPGGKRSDWALYDRCGKVSKTWRQDIENDANAFMEQYEYEVDLKDEVTIIDSRLKKHTNAAGSVTEYEYDSTTKLLKKKTDPQTAAGRLVTEYTYDGARRLIAETKSKQGNSAPLHRTVNHYNPATGYLDWTREDGFSAEGYNTATTYYQYNGLGQVIRQANPDGVKTGKSYGSGGQLVSEFTLAEGSDPNAPDSELTLISQTLYTYNADGQIEKIGKVKTDGIFIYKSAIDNPADPNYWVVTKYEYYPDGKQKKVIEDFGGSNLTTEYFYNLQGEVEKVLYPTGKWVKTTRDGRGLVILEEVGHGTSTVALETSYDYDADGNLKEQHNPDGTSQIYQYDNFGQLKKVYQQDPDGPYTEKFYDDAGNVNRELSMDSDGTLLRDIRREYDAVGNVEMERLCAEPNVVNDAEDFVTWYKYDVLGNPQYTVQDGPSCSDPNSIADPNNIVTEYIYDGLGRKQQTLSPVGVLSSVFYSAAGLPIKIVDPNNPQDPNTDCITRNSYDAAGRLEKSINPEGHYTVNVYNSLNQLIKQTVYDCNETPDNTDNDFAVRQTRTQYDNLGNVSRQAIMKIPASQSDPVVGVDMITDYVYETGLLRQVSRHSHSGLSQTETYYYDSIGRKIRTVDAEGNEDSITYSQDAPALVEKTQRLEKDPANSANNYTITTFFDYDDYGRLWKRILDLDGNGQKDIGDTTTEYLHDGLGRLTNEIASDGIVVFTDYDGFGNIRQTIEDYYPQNSEHFNKTTEYVYNRLNRLSQIKAYDPNDTDPQVVSTQKTTYEYDKAGLVTKITYPDNKFVRYMYNIQGKVDTEIQRNGKWIAYWYDGSRNQIQVSDYDAGDPNCPISAATFVEQLTYDATGNLKTADKVEDGLFIASSEFTYNGFGLKTSETAIYFDLDPITITWDYDGSGNLISQTLEDLTLSYTHDALGRIKTIDRNGNRIVNYSYIGSSTKAIEYPEPQVTQSYSYDELGRVDGVGSVDGSDATILDFVYDYDAIGNRRSEKYNHLTTPVWDKYTYDHLRRLEQVDYAATSGFASITQNRSSVIPNPLVGEESVYKLSFLASLAVQWLDDETSQISKYHHEGHEEREENNPVNPVNPVKNYSSVNSVSSVANNIYSLAEFGQAPETNSKVRTETIYNDNGQLSAQIVYDANGNITLFAIYLDDGGKVVVTSYYDTTGNMISNICTTYDDKGNVLGREDMPLPTETTIKTVIPNPLAGEESVDSAASSFSQADLWLLEAELLYGDGGMMLMSSTPEASEFAFEEFVYDNLGNRYLETTKDGTLFTYSHNAVNQYSKRHGSVMGIFEYDEYYAHDDNGNLEMDENGRTYLYDYRNRLTEIKDAEGNSIAEYTYDALGRRIAKTVGNTQTLFYYNPSQQVIAEYEGTAPQLTREYVYGNGITEVLAMFLPQYDVGQEDFEQFLGFCEAWLSNDAQYDHNSDGTVDYIDFAYFAGIWGSFPSNTESHFYYLTDALGSVRGLIGGKFNREEDREFYNYDVYGATTDISVVGNPILFAGYRIDAESGLYHLWTRAYDPVTGRPLQMDQDYYDSMNLHEYALSNPTNFVDPWGLWSYQGMYQSFLQTYGQEGLGLLQTMYDSGYMPVGYPDDEFGWDTGWDDYQWDDASGQLRLPQSWWGGFVDSDEAAAKQLYNALKGRWGKLAGKVAKCICDKASAQGQAYQNAQQQGLNDMPEVGDFTGAYEQQQRKAQEIGSSLQNYAEEEAMAYIASVVGGKCLDEALEALKDAGRAKKLAKAAKAANNAEKTIKPGPYAKESIPARSSAQQFTPDERSAINNIGKESGCHSCGSTDPGTKSGNFIPDHQPPSALNNNNMPQRLYPHCINCSRKQGGTVTKIRRNR